MSITVFTLEETPDIVDLIDHNLGLIVWGCGDTDEYYVAQIPITPGKPTAIFVHGLPGSGKSTLAGNISMVLNCLKIEPDPFCVSGGEYRYTVERYAAAVRIAKEVVDIATTISADFVYADVLPKREDIISIVRDYIPSTYNVVVISMPKITKEESLARNIHSVRPEDIDRMIAEWEDWEEGAE